MPEINNSYRYSFSFSSKKLENLNLSVTRDPERESTLGKITVKLPINQNCGSLQEFLDQFSTNTYEGKIELLIKYFSVDNNYDLPLIFDNLIGNNATNNDLVNQRKKFIKVCDLALQLLANTTITKKYWKFFDDTSFQNKLITTITHMKSAAAILNNIDACETNPLEFEKVFNELYSEIALLKRIKGEYDEFDFEDTVTSEGLVNGLPNLGYTTSTWKNFAKIDTFNVGIDTMSAVLWAAFSSNLISHPKFWMLKLTVQKKLILYMADSFKRKNYAFTPQQQQFMVNVLSHKRGNRLQRYGSRVIFLKTKSYNELTKILSDSNKNVAINQDQTKIISALNTSNVDYSVSSTHNETISSKELYTEVDYIHEIKDKLTKGEYSEISEMLKEDGGKLHGKMELTISTSFKFQGIYGTLYTHLLILNKKQKNYKINDLLNQIELTITKLFDDNNNSLSARFPLVHKIKTECKDYASFYLFLKKFRPEKQVAIDGISQIIFVLKTTPDDILSLKQKESLLQLLRSQIKLASDGNFSDLRNKRSIFYSNLFFGITAFNGMSLYKYFQPLDPIPSSMSYGMPGFGNFLLARTLESSVGWSLTALLPLACQWFETGDTRSFLSIEAALDSVTFDDAYHERIKKYEEEVKYAEEKTTLDKEKIPQTTNETDKKLEYIQEYILTIRQYIAENKYEEIITLLNQIKEKDKKFLYCVLSGKTSGRYLIDILLEKFQSTLPNDHSTNNFKQIWQIWCEAQPSLVNNDSDKAQDEMVQFKSYLSSINFNTADDALFGFYTVMGIIGNTQDEEIKIKKLKYFAEVIMRAAHDRTSKWAMLRKTSRNRELIYSTIMRVIGIVIYASINSVVFAGAITGGVSIVFALLCSGAVRGLFNGLSNLFAYSNTIEYEKCSQLLFPEDVQQQENLKRILDLSLDSGSARNSKTYTSCTEKITTAIKNYELSANGVSITNIKLNEYLKNNEIGDDKSYIDKLENASSNQDKKIQADEILKQLSWEAVDKYAATEVMYRFVRIIMLAKIDETIRLEILVALEILLMRREINVAQHISKERSALAANNYLLPDISFGLFSGIANVISCSISGVPMTVINTLFDISSALSLKYGVDKCLSSNSSDQHNTKSFQQVSSFIGLCIIDQISKIKKTNKNTEGSTETVETEEINASGNQKEIDLEQLIGLARLILATHTDRYPIHFSEPKLFAEFNAMFAEGT